MRPKMFAGLSVQSAKSETGDSDKFQKLRASSPQRST